jgi:hydroxymethylpyrimidine pyrophosphatase-like HAD family hydrolase
LFSTWTALLLKVKHHTKPGIDKAYGIRKLRDIFGIEIAEMIFIGDALFPGGNDYPAEESGVACLS